MKVVVFFVVLKFSVCEWVEISTLKTKNYFHIKKNNLDLTTPISKNSSISQFDNVFKAYDINEHINITGTNDSSLRQTWSYFKGNLSQGHKDEETDSEEKSESNPSCPDIHNLTWATWSVTNSQNWSSVNKSNQKVGQNLPDSDDSSEKLLPKSLDTKLEFLEDLKNKLETAIADNAIQLWGGPERRMARGKMEFPSMAGALISIAFLTFAVFKIKLIIQLIEKLKNKNRSNVPPANLQSVMPGLQTAGVPQVISFTQGRKRRSIDMDDISISRLIEEFNLKFS